MAAAFSVHPKTGSAMACAMIFATTNTATLIWAIVFATFARALKVVRMRIVVTNMENSFLQGTTMNAENIRGCLVTQLGGTVVCVLRELSVTKIVAQMVAVKHVVITWYWIRLYLLYRQHYFLRLVCVKTSSSTVIPQSAVPPHVENVVETTAKVGQVEAIAAWLQLLQTDVFAL